MPAFMCLRIIQITRGVNGSKLTAIALLMQATVSGTSSLILCVLSPDYAVTWLIGRGTYQRQRRAVVAYKLAAKTKVGFVLTFSKQRLMQDDITHLVV